MSTANEPNYETNTKGEMKKNVWRCHGELISKLLQHLEGRRNVNKETISIASSIKANFDRMQRLQEWLDKSTNEEELSQVQDRMEVDLPGREAGTAPLSSTPTRSTGNKRKDRSLNAEDGNVPKRKVPHDPQRLAAQMPSAENGPSGDQNDGWQIASKKKEKAKKKKKSAKMPRKPRTLPNALLISAKEEKSYADILRKLKEGVPENEAEGAIEKVRRTTTGKLLIVLNRKIGDKIGPLQSKIAEALKEEAEVTRRMQQVDLEIRDIEETTTKEEVYAALTRTNDGSQGVPVEAVRSLRVAYGQTQTASVRLPVEVARKIVGARGKIRIGLVNCSIREVNRPRRCYKCWHVGHVANRCKSDIDRSKICIKCGTKGHKVSQCKNEAKCVLCVENGKQDNCDHVAGSYKCSVIAEETRKTTNKRR